jgi:drug/metabolite transporter (DMT)-like permease
LTPLEPLAPTPPAALPAAAWRTDLLMLLAALIWGSTFVAQQKGMEGVGPYTFTGVRFLLGALVVLPFWRQRPAWLGQPLPTVGTASGRFTAAQPPWGGSRLWWHGGLLGLVLFGGVNAQQVGLLGTTVSNAGFITGLYVVLVPFMLTAMGQRVQASLWAAVALATSGLYLLSVKPGSGIAAGDWLQLLSAFIWAVHVVLVGVLARRHDPLRLAIVQYLVCGLLSLAIGLVQEAHTLTGYLLAAPAILWGGLLSVGVAYTLQVVAQKTAIASHAAVIYSSEGLVSAICGALVLGERIGLRGMVGGALMLAAMLLAQWRRLPEPEPH